MNGYGLDEEEDEGEEKGRKSRECNYKICGHNLVFEILKKRRKEE
jgi:hypothetical protein